jgi:hypothetical protein
MHAYDAVMLSTLPPAAGDRDKVGRVTHCPMFGRAASMPVGRVQGGGVWHW